MGDYHSITVTEQILESKDLTHKKAILLKYKNRLGELDQSLYNLVNNIIIGEDQKGEVVDAMWLETILYMFRNRGILSQLETRINGAVDELDTQVDDMKTQQMTITYEDTPSA
ncbi:hypothetical protein [Oceanobacillus senegalensis]|uniref:hypothetical protein n=1 Tax=Oceanobacillus senegalensis TaxID=1936063 RepID=UPI000A30BBA0|nr:hypothetical protein [Oceanobacillus senegalensis]